MIIPDPQTLPFEGPERDPAQQRAARIVQDVLEQRRKGIQITDDHILRLYPELEHELRTELFLAAQIHQAMLAADRAGPAPRRLDVLTDSELERSIAASADSGDTQSPLTDVLPRIPHYRIEKEISRGGQATVYLAVQESTDRPVAIKVMPGGSFVSSDHRTRFDREAKLLASFDHPNIVGILERGRSPDGSFFFVMQYVDGLPLDLYWTESIKRDSAGTRAVVDLFRKIAEAVEAAHERGVIHRDLKPSNIRVDRRGEPHVLDFGLARTATGAEDVALRTITTPGQLVGSLPWASPEQVSRAGDELGASSDVYSLGVIIYQALTGEFPYRLDGPMDHVLLRIRTAVASAASKQPGARPSIDRFLDAIVKKCLAKTAAERYASAGDLGRDLQSWLDGRTPKAWLSRGERARSWLVRRRALAAAVFTLVALSMGLLGAYRLFLREEAPVIVALPSRLNAVSMRMVLLPAGKVVMGSPESEPGRDRSERQREVEIAHPFYISANEVQQWQFELVMGSNPSDARWKSQDLPVQNVTWHEANEFCQRLSVRDHRHYRLPTEAEWEYACQATSDTPFNGLRSPDRIGWFADNSGGAIHLPAKKWPNSWTLSDMHGNVAEWCDDYFDIGSGVRATTNPDDPSILSQRVVKGGSALTDALQCRAAARLGLDPDTRAPDVGIRVVCDR